MTFARLFASWRVSIILTLIQATRLPRKSSRRFPRRTTSLATRRNGRFTTSLGSTLTTSIRLQRRLTRGAVGNLEQRIFRAGIRVGGRLALLATSILAALIFRIFSKARAPASESLRATPAAGFAIFSRAFLRA